MKKIIVLCLLVISSLSLTSVKSAPQTIIPDIIIDINTCTGDSAVNSYYFDIIVPKESIIPVPLILLAQDTPWGSIVDFITYEDYLMYDYNNDGDVSYLSFSDKYDFVDFEACHFVFAQEETIDFESFVIAAFNQEGTLLALSESYSTVDAHLNDNAVEFQVLFDPTDNSFTEELITSEIDNSNPLFGDGDMAIVFLLIILMVLELVALKKTVQSKSIFDGVVVSNILTVVVTYYALNSHNQIVYLSPAEWVIVLQITKFILITSHKSPRRSTGIWISLLAMFLYVYYLFPNIL